MPAPLLSPRPPLLSPLSVPTLTLLINVLAETAAHRNVEKEEEEDEE